MNDVQKSGSNGGVTTAGGALARFLGSPAADVAVVVGLIVLAALLRLPDLATRGPWDTDQGEQMLAIRSIVQGQLTLLGAPTSTGGIHHGAVFYYIGALFALPSGGDDPTAVTFGIALGGIATVVFVWWMARAAGGPVAGLVAGLLAAVSAQMIDASVRLWNPAFVAPAAAFALAAALEGRRRGDPRWWVAVGIGVVLAGQSHVLAWVLVAPIAVLAIGELRRTGRRALPWLAAAVGIVVLSFVPVLVSELLTGFGEVRALLDAQGGPRGRDASHVAPADLRAVPHSLGAPRGRGPAVDRGVGGRRLARDRCRARRGARSRTSARHVRGARRRRAIAGRRRAPAGRGPDDRVPPAGGRRPVAVAGDPSLRRPLPPGP